MIKRDFYENFVFVILSNDIIYISQIDSRQNN